MFDTVTKNNKKQQHI